MTAFCLKSGYGISYAEHMEQTTRNIVLTGFRATGKTSVGRLLAAKLGYRFVDADQLLSERLGSTIAECVARHGWERFRKAERQLLAEAPAMRRTVLATGGGAIEHQPEWQKLRDRCLVVWLDADIATIRQRLGSDPQTAVQRPSLTGVAVEDELEQVLRRRLPLYAAGSDLRLETAGVAPEDLAERISNEIEKMEAERGVGQGGEDVTETTQQRRENGNG